MHYYFDLNQPVLLPKVEYTCYGIGDSQSNTISTVTDSTTDNQYTIFNIGCYHADCYLRVAARNTANKIGLFSEYGRNSTSCPSALPSSASDIRMEPSLITLFI